MSTRFTDKRKRDDHWYRRLDRDQRDIYEYLLDQCDEAGFAEIDIDAIADETLIMDNIRVTKGLKALTNPFRRVTKVYVRGKSDSDIKVAWIPSYISFQELRKIDHLNPLSNFHNKILRRLLRMKDLFPEVVDMYVKPSGYTGTEKPTPWGAKKDAEKDRGMLGVSKGLHRDWREEKRERVIDKLKGECEGETKTVHGKGALQLESRGMTNAELKGKHVLYDKILDCADLRASFPYEAFVELRKLWPDTDVNWNEIVEWITKLHIMSAPGKGVSNAYTLISSMIKKGKFKQTGAPDPNLNPELAQHARIEKRISREYAESMQTDEDAEKCRAAHKANDEKFGVRGKK